MAMETQEIDQVITLIKREIQESEQATKKREDGIYKAILLATGLIQIELIALVLLANPFGG